MNDTMWFLGMTLEELEKKVILKCLLLNGNNKTATAKCLDIALKTLHNKLDKYAEDKNELQRRADDSEKKVESSLRAQGWKQMEPAKEMAAEQSVPMRKSEEVQKVSRKPTPSNHPDKRA